MAEIDPLSKTGAPRSRFPAARRRLGSNRSINTETSQEVTTSFIQSESSLGFNESNREEAIQPTANGNVDQSDGENSEDVSEDPEENSSDDEISEVEDIVDTSTSSVKDEEETRKFTYNSNKLHTKAPTKITQTLDKKSFNQKHIILCIFLFSIVFTVSFVCLTNTKETFDLETVKDKFPTQEPDLWWAFESGVQDVVERNRPSTFILLYQEEAQDTLSSLVKQLSKYAVCNITDCSNEPIVITDTLLNSTEIVDDFGWMITKYKSELEKKGVMVIKNLENVRGVSAQAFHSFCDEFTPLVHKSLFIFTMKVDKLHGPNKMRFIEEYFKNKWTDIKVDTLNALITRISSMVLEVMP